MFVVIKMNQIGAGHMSTLFSEASVSALILGGVQSLR